MEHSFSMFGIVLKFPIALGKQAEQVNANFNNRKRQVYFSGT